MRASISAADSAFYREQGYFIFRQILPASLITDLRRTATKALELARKLNGPQAQRLQGLDQHAEIGLAPLEAFMKLPALVEGVHALLSPRHRIAAPGNMSFLFEPAEQCWATEWHRDWRDHLSPAHFAEAFDGGWEPIASDPNLFNQINCALYDDPCTWFVPGTNRRLDDTPGEAAAAKRAGRADVENKDHRRTEAEQEIFLNNYCGEMPGAISLRLQAGDLALYRSVAWHTGSYVPYRRRATLHCSASTPEYEKFWKRTAGIVERKLPASVGS
ncbi:MAG: hypothetical protein JWM32_594 [Verrucomicrobia bacterium]|nr:hypothetical protein [Verrucomicrobiota bacterium]